MCRHEFFTTYNVLEQHHNFSSATMDYSNVTMSYPNTVFCVHCEKWLYEN